MHCNNPQIYILSHRHAIQRTQQHQDTDWNNMPLRVSQLDALLLDAELQSLLTEELTSASTSHSLDYPEELACILRLVIYSLSYFPSNSSYGLQLMNLAYPKRAFAIHCSTELKDSSQTKTPRLTHIPPVSSWRKLCHFFLHVPLPYLSSKLSARLTMAHYFAPSPASASTRPSSVSLFAAYLNLVKIVSTLDLLNFLVFLVRGRYRSLGDRILGLELCYVKREMVKRVSFEIMNRQLVWSGFTVCTSPQLFGIRN